MAVNAPHLCRDDNWGGEILGDESPRAIRWATGWHGFNETFSRWHWTEGNGSFTACGRPVVINADGAATTFPEEREVEKVDCRSCRARMAAAGVTLPSS